MLKPPLAVFTFVFRSVNLKSAASLGTIGRKKPGSIDCSVALVLFAIQGLDLCFWGRQVRKDSHLIQPLAFVASGARHPKQRSNSLYLKSKLDIQLISLMLSNFVSFLPSVHRVLSILASPGTSVYLETCYLLLFCFLSFLLCQRNNSQLNLYEHYRSHFEEMYYNFSGMQHLTIFLSFDKVHKHLV